MVISCPHALRAAHARVCPISAPSHGADRSPPAVTPARRPSLVPSRFCYISSRYASHLVTVPSCTYMSVPSPSVLNLVPFPAVPKGRPCSYPCSHPVSVSFSFSLVLLRAPSRPRSRLIHLSTHLMSLSRIVSSHPCRLPSLSGAVRAVPPRPSLTILSHLLQDTTNSRRLSLYIVQSTAEKSPPTSPDHLQSSSSGVEVLSSGSPSHSLIRFAGAGAGAEGVKPRTDLHHCATVV